MRFASASASPSLPLHASTARRCCTTLTICCGTSQTRRPAAGLGTCVDMAIGEPPIPPGLAALDCAASLASPSVDSIHIGTLRLYGG